MTLSARDRDLSPITSLVESDASWLAAFAVAFALGFAAAAYLLGMRNCFAFWSRGSTKLQEIASFAATGEEVKMTLVVRKDLKMGTGKIAAQCAHAAVAVVEEILALKESRREDTSAGGKHPWVQYYEAWHLTGCSKVALQCLDEDTLLAVSRAAREKGLPSYVIRDAGRTQIAPGSKTVVAVGPGPKSLVDEVTGTLKLL